MERRLFPLLDDDKAAIIPRTLRQTLTRRTWLWDFPLYTPISDDSLVLKVLWPEGDVKY